MPRVPVFSSLHWSQNSTHTAGRFTHLIVSEWLVPLTCHSDVLARNFWTMLASNIQACLNVLHMCDENDSKITSPVSYGNTMHYTKQLHKLHSHRDNT